MSGNFLTTLNETRHCITNAFNEARLDSGITDNMIHLDGYDVIRKGDQDKEVLESKYKNLPTSGSETCFEFH